jgi:predicted nucleotidyltransferase
MGSDFSPLIKAAADNVLKAYQHKAGVLAILLIGSAAQGNFDKYSDIDFLIIFKKKQKLTSKHYVEKSGIMVELQYFDLAELKNYIKEEKYGLRRNASYMLADAKVILFKDKVIEDLIKSAQFNIKTKTRYSNKEIMMHLYSIDDYLGDARRDADKGDCVAFYIDSTRVIQNEIDLILKINDQHSVKAKAMKALLSSLNSEFCDLLIAFNKETAIDKRLAVLEAMKTVAVRVAGKDLADNWEI